MTVLRFTTPQSLGLSSERAWTAEDEAPELTPEMFRILRTIVENVREGHPVTVSTSAALLTTTQAAEELGISRPTLYRLLDEEVLPAVPVRSQRRVPAAAITAYKLLREARLSTAEFEDAIGAIRDAGVTSADFDTIAAADVSDEAAIIADRALDRAFASAAGQ